MRNSHSPLQLEPPPEDLPSTRPGDRMADRIAARAWQQLSQSPYRELKRVTCGTKNGVLVLRGKVSSFYLKQLAQEIVRKTVGVEAIANDLEVQTQPV